MKKKLIISLIIIVIITTAIIILLPKEQEKFYLDNQYYEKSELIEINSYELENLEKNKKSFVVFIYQPYCTTSYDFNDYIIEFLEDNKITFYKTLFSNINDTSISNYVKYCPSAVIYQEGKIIAYLDANLDKDTIYFESTKNFEKWITQYILLKKNN